MSERITSYHVEFTSKARKQLKKFDRFDARIIVTWIQKNLEGCEDPRALGKGLTSNRSGEWRYRVGSYRILAYIHDQKVTIEIFAIGHRKDIYDA